MEALQRENAKLREELRALQAKYDDFENSTNEKIQKLIDENEILAEANRLLLEKQAGFDSIVKEPQLNQIPDELLLPGNGVVTTEVAIVEEVHSFGNLLCVASHHFKPEIVISGGVDKQLVVSDWKRKIKLCVFEASAPVLDVAFNPKQEYGDYIVATFMDAKHSLLRLENHDGIWKIEQLFSFHDHNRHGAMKVAWSHDGVLFATGSSDKSLNVYKCSDLNNSTKLPSCEKFKSFFFNGTVEAIVFVPPSNVGVPEYLVVSVRDDCYMHYIDCNTFEKERYANEVLRNKSYSGANSSCSCDGLNRINMNQDGIEHVSFTIMDLQVSPSGKYLLAATDTSRHFIFGIKSNVVLRNFYGHKAGSYSQPRATWHPSEKYIISNTEDSGSLYIWCIASERVVDTIQAHEKVIRDLCIGHDDALLTVSYDKRLKVWSSIQTRISP